MEKKATTTRKSVWHLRVPVRPDEEEAIKEKARQAGLTVATYLRHVGMGHEIEGGIDA